VYCTIRHKVNLPLKQTKQKWKYLMCAVKLATVPDLVKVKGNDKTEKKTNEQ